MSMTRSEFNETFRSVISEEFADIPPESEIQYEFSKEFLDKMQKLINGTEDDTHKAQKKHRSSVAIKRIVALAAALIVLFAGIMSVGAVREPVVNFIFKTYEGFKRVLFSGDSLTEIDHVYAFAEVPEGFVETQRISNKEMNLVRYENGETALLSNYLNQSQPIILSLWIVKTERSEHLMLTEKKLKSIVLSRRPCSLLFGLKIHTAWS